MTSTFGNIVSFSKFELCSANCFFFFFSVVFEQIFGLRFQI